MDTRQAERWSRREFLGGLALTGTAGLLGMQTTAVAGEPPPETKKITLAHTPSVCQAPQYLAAEFLRAEGFTEVQYLKVERGIYKPLASGKLDVSFAFCAPLLIHVDASDPIVLLAGVHPGCFELFASDDVRTIRDLKGKTVAVRALGSTEHVFLTIMAAHVGLDPRKDIRWALHPVDESKRLLAEGKIDAFMAFPPTAQEVRANKIGHVVVNSMMDRPWAQYFCCVAAGNRDFVRQHPVATKRALRAILKAADVCAREPERVARFLVDRGYTKNYDYALEALRQISYGQWREYDPEDTVRFYALRLHEAGIIKSSPKKIIAAGTDWRFLNELKKELKG